MKRKKYFQTFCFSFFSRLGITIILTLLLLILLKNHSNLKMKFYQLVYETNFSFASINEWYKKQFGSPIPFGDFMKEEVTVFEEKLTYKESSKYLDGVSLTVNENYMIPILKTGIVVFVGEKEGYGKTVIIEQSDGVDVWYGNLKDETAHLYSYVEEGTLLGETNNNVLYLVFKKNGVILDYDEYI